MPRYQCPMCNGEGHIEKDKYLAEIPETTAREVSFLMRRSTVEQIEREIVRLRLQVVNLLVERADD